MKQRVTMSPQTNVHGGGDGAGLLWVLITLVMVALVFLPVLFD